MTTALIVKLSGERPAWPDLSDHLQDVIHIANDPVRMPELAVLEGGMASGKPSVALRIDLPDTAQVVVLELSWDTLALAVRAIAARVGWPA